MKGLLKRIVGATLCLAMAIGVSVGVVSNREAKPVYATPSTYSLTPDQASTGSESTTYITTLTEFTYSGISWKMNQWNPKSLQIKTNQSDATNEFRFYNTSAFSARINSVVIKFSALTVSDASKLMFLGGSSEVSATSGGTAGTWNSTSKTLTWTPGNSDNFTYFAFYQNGKAASGTNYLASSDAIVVSYGGGNTPTLESIALSGSMTKTSYTTAENWDPSGLTVTGSYDSGPSANLTTSATFNYYSDSEMTIEKATPNALGAGNDQTIYIKATVSGVSNTSGYSQTVSVSVVTFSVTYNDNGATSGSVPTDATAYNNNASVTVLGNTGSLAKTGYVWGGWNTATDGSGTDYSSGATFNITSNTTLYARWFSNHSNDNNIVITANYLNLTSTATAATTVLKATDGMRYMVSSGAKYTGVSGDNKFDGSSNSVILIGTTDAFLYNNDAFQKDIYKIELFSNDGASTAVKVAVNFGTSVCSDSYSEEETTLETDDTRYAFSPDIEHARYFRVQVTNNKNAQVQIKVYFVTPTTSVTVSPASVTLAPKATKQLTTTVLPVDRTDSLTYSTSDADVATVSAAGLITAKAVGTARITATSGSYSAYCDVTVETIPVITPASYSASGYTGGDDEVIEITYADLKGTLNVATENDKVEAVIQNNDGESHAEVKISFVKAGDCDVYLRDGSTTLATIEVSVTASIVTITNMPVSRAVRVGATLNLGSLITVTPTGSCSSAVTWSSSASGVATVTQAGVVTAVSNGSAVITVTPNDYHDGAVTCSILVAQAVSANFGTTDNDGSAVTTDSAIKEISGYVIDSNFKFSSLSNCYASANNSMKFGTSSKKASFTVGLNDNKVDGKLAFITRIVVTAKKYGSDSTTINIAGEGKELTASFAEYTVDFDNHTTTSVDIEASAASSQRFRISCISLYYEFLAKEVVKESDTLASLAYNYTQTGPNAYTFSKTSIRFGGFMDKTLWDRLDNESEIQGYGVLVSTDTYLGAESFEEWYEFFDGEIVGDHTQKDVIDELIDGDHIKGFYTSVPGDKEHPAEATTDQKAYMGVDAGDDYYVWTYRKNVAEADLTTDYVGVAFIVIDGDIVFLQQTTASAQSLAQDLIDNTDCTAASYDGSLGYLAGL